MAPLGPGGDRQVTTHGEIPPKTGRLPLLTVCQVPCWRDLLACVTGGMSQDWGGGLAKSQKWHHRIRVLIPRGESRQVKIVLFDGRRNRTVVS